MIRQRRLTKRQWLIFIVFGIVDFCNAICVSLQAPFYPKEAEKKGCTATEYGFVFGVFELIVFIVSPLFGQSLNAIGSEFLFTAGITTTATCSILFGLLDRVHHHEAFLGLSLLIRMIEATGNAAFLTASFAIIANEFPDNVATTFAILETFFGVGLILGPTIGGILYEFGGFTLPFVSMGGTLLVATAITSLLLPERTEDTNNNNNSTSILSALKIPAILLDSFSIVCTSISIGFLQATLEPHLRQFQLNQIVVSLMFVINGALYALTAPIWGWLCDNYISTRKASFFGAMLICVSFLLIGPASFLPLQSSLKCTIIGLVFHGFGIAAQLVASFSDALKTSVSYGFPNDIKTFGLISGLWTSMFALGAFIGPVMSGILFDRIGFRKASLAIILLQLLVMVLIFVSFICDSTYNWQNFSRRKIISRNRNYADVGNDEFVQQSRPNAMNTLVACNSHKVQAMMNKNRENEFLLSEVTRPLVVTITDTAANAADTNISLPVPKTSHNETIV